MMKATKLITLGIFAGTVSFAAAQDAAPDQPARQPRGDRPVPAETLKKFDKDGDGKLSEEETKALQDERRAENEKRQAENLKKYDKDGDGKLSEDERKTMQDEVAAKRRALTEKYDANKDGRLDADETKAARDAGEEIPMGGRGGGGQGGQGGRGARGGQGGQGGANADKPGEGAPKSAETPPAQ